MKIFLEILFRLIYIYIIGFFWIGLTMVAITIEYRFKFREALKFVLECAAWSWLGIWAILHSQLRRKIKEQESLENNKEN